MGSTILEVGVRVGFVLVTSFLLTILTLFVMRLAKIDIKDFSQRTGTPFMSLALMGNLTFIGVVYLFIRFADQKSFRSLGFHFSWWYLIWSILGCLFTFCLSVAFLMVLRSLGKANFNVSLTSFKGIKKEVLSFSLSFFVLFVAALQEEIMYRGYLGFTFHDYGFALALILSTIIFTVWHFISNKVSVFQVIDWLICGLVLFVVFWESHSIWLVAILHFSRNLSNVLIWNIADTYSFFSFEKRPRAVHKTLYTAIWAGIIWVVSLAIWH